MESRSSREPSPRRGTSIDPVLREDAGGLTLLFEEGVVQSRMIQAEPWALVLEYTRLMMGFLLLQPAPARIAMIGLGGGSLAKYCGFKLRSTDFTAVEIAPAVIALRDAFGIPVDGPTFRIVEGDGAEFVRGEGEPFDVLLVDGFDRCGQPEQLSSPAFYDACRDRLTDTGVLVVNLQSDDPAHEVYVHRIRDSFSGRIACVSADDTHNMVVFAGMTAPFPPPFGEMVERLRALETLHPVGLDVTLRKIAQYTEPRKGTRRPRRRR